jgi:hypothetical protein
MFMATAWAATDSFVGDWKLNTSRSRFIDRMQVQGPDGDRYTFDFGGGSERIVADGTDQPGAYGGTTLSLTIEGPGSWKVVRKKDGRRLLTATWKLSQDGDTLSDSYTEFAADGSASTVDYLYRRTAAGAGFAGAWECAMPINSAASLQIRSYEESGFSFIRSAQDTRNLKFDGKDYPVAGAGVAAGSVWSGRRVGERVLEISEKSGGKLVKTEQVELSSDLKTLTRTVRPAGQHEPNVFVFERQ